MLLTEYLDSIESTEQETEFIEKIAKLEEHFVQAAQTPVVGKMIRALIAFGQADSITDFKESEYYEAFKDWEIKIDPDTGGFSIIPGPKQRKKALIVLACVVAGIFLLVRFVKKRRHR